MGLLTSITTAIDHLRPRTASAPSLFRSSSIRIKHRLALRGIGVLAIASVVGAGAAADHVSNVGQPSPQSTESKHTSIQLDQSAVTPSASSQSTANSGASPDTHTTGSSITTSGTASNDGITSFDVTVNGQPVAVPNNGSSTQVITTPDSTTTVDVNSNVSANGSNFSTNSTTTHANSFSTTVDQTANTERTYGSP